MFFHQLTTFQPVPIVQDDDTVISPPLCAIVVTAVGTLTVVGENGVTTALEIPQGAALPYTFPCGRVVKVKSTGTDLADADLVGLKGS